MLYKRDPAKYLNTSSVALSKIAKWFNTKLVSESWNGENNESCWISFGTNSGNDKISIYNATTFALEATLATPGSAGGTCQIIPFANDVRFANGVDRDVSIWAYNYDTKFFLGAITKTVGMKYGSAHLNYPANWTHQSISIDDFGNLPIGHYYYKIVGVYDGVQEMELPEAYNYVFANNEQGNTLSMTFDMDASNDTLFSPRIKSLKIYRGYAKENIDVVYNHIKTIAVNTASGDAGATQALTGLRGCDTSTKVILIDPDYDFTPLTGVQAGGAQAYVKFYDTTGEERILLLTDGEMGDGWCTLYDANGVTNTDRMWLSHFSILVGVAGYASAIPQDGGDNGCIGDNVLWDSGASWKNSQFTNWTLPVTGGNTVTILGNYGNIFRLSAGHGKTLSGTIAGTATEVGAYFTEVGGVITMQFIDTGYANGAEHPLDGVTKTKMNYKYGALHNGRMFGLYVSLDPDDEDEQHENWLGYSEFNQYDTMPVNNIIPLVDARGGIGTGVISAGGFLVVFSETGIFRVNVPTVDPYGWRVEQGIETMGCTAPDSIMTAEGVIFFANTTGIWALTPGDFQLYEISYDVKDQYLDASNPNNSRITYDPHKRRLICRFGDTKTTQHIFDIEKFLAGSGETAWTTQLYDEASTSAHSAPSFAVIDEDLKLYGISHWTNASVPSTGFSQLYGHASGAETLACVITTPWLSIPDIDFNIIWRKLGLVLKQLGVASDAENITINIYQDKFDTIDGTHGSTHTFSANTTDDYPYVSLTVTEEIIRLAMRSTFLKIEIITTKTNSNDFELHRIEAVLDD